MTPRELIDNLALIGEQELPVILNYLADQVYESTLESGVRLTDASDFHDWLRQLARAAKAATLGENNGLDIPRGVHRFGVEDTCPRCGHIHEGSAECGFDIGGGRRCRCEMEVPA